MQALKTLTTHKTLPDTKAQLATFDKKFANAVPAIWHEFSIAFSTLLELNVILPFEKVIKHFSDKIYARIVYYSEDPQTAPISLIPGDIFGACGMIRAGLQTDGILADLELKAYAEANLELDQDGWIRRTPGTRTIGKFNERIQLEKELAAMDNNPVPDFTTHTREYIASFKRFVKERGFKDH